MKKGKNIQLFGELLGQKIGGSQKIQTSFAVVESVDWKQKTMVAKGVRDDLAFNDVHLGLGSFFRKPKIGAMCLIGLIENQEAATFLIDCEAFNEAIYTCESTEFKIKPDGFVVKQDNENLKTIMLDWVAAIKAMVFTTNAGPTINLVNAPQFTALEPRIKQLLKDD